MTELLMMENVLSVGIGALVAVYVILGIMLALGVYALVRLAVLAKKTRNMKPQAAQAPDCEACEKLQEKDREIAALQEKIRELEQKPLAPVVVVPEEERTLAESLEVASASGRKGLISKKSIIAYLSTKYENAVELNGRANRTSNGKLLLSDNHFAFSPLGKRVCFTYVYETDGGQVVALVKLDEPYVQGLRVEHPEVMRSAFPKNKAKDWYSVVADDTFTPQAYYDVLDRAIALIRDEALPVQEQPAPVEEAEAPEVTLKESIAAAKETGASGLVSKKSIIEHLTATFGEKVECNNRANRTPNGKLLMSDNHFAFAPDGKRVCFTYVYEDDDGKVTVLLRTTADHAKDIRNAHSATGFKSAFPKNKEKDWYSMVVDNTFTEQGVYTELDRAVYNIIGVEITTPAQEPETEVTLKESIAAAKETGAVGLVSKKSIIDHLAATFGDKVELNNRANRTPNGKLLMSDNHFAYAPDGKRVCFTYVYEDEGNVTILLRTTEAHAAAIHAAHPATGLKSAFPKNKEKDWYSVVVDNTFTEQGVYAELDKAVYNIIGAEIAAPAQEPEEEVTLKESITAAKQTGASGLVSKKSIIEHLTATFGEKVECNNRANRTPNGKLLMSDNHFAFAPDGKRVCFTYVYEDDDGKVTVLLRTTADHAKDIRNAHSATGFKSAFPKNKEKDWYSVVVDNTFTEQGVYAELDRAVYNIIGGQSALIEQPEGPAEIPAEKPIEEAPAEQAEEQEISLKESIAAAKQTGAIGLVSKKSIFNHLAATFEDKVELCNRANRTPNGKLLMSDNHFAFAPDGKRVCFTYIYEDDEGRVTVLLRTTEEQAAEIRAEHPATGAKSAFPKNKEKDWYSVVVDGTFTEAGVYAMIDKAVRNITEREVAAPLPAEEVTLKESIAAAKETGAVGLVSKKSIIDHLAATFGDKVELNNRANRTPNGKLLMSDNHFAFAPDGKRVCFTYIYEDEGNVTILLRTTEAHAAAIHAAHPATGLKSAFPKNKEKDWYSVVVDNTFTEQGVYAELDKAVKNIVKE